MKVGLSIGIACSVAIHGGILLFGGLPFSHHDQDKGTLQQVELVSKDDAGEKKKDKPEEPPPEKTEELEAVKDEAPDPSKIAAQTEISAAQSAPELEAASLGAIEAALSGQPGGGGDFSEGVSFSSGGRIGGMGKGGGGGELGQEFNLSEIDQKPRAVSQVPPIYPAGMRSVEGVVTLIFIVDASGRVTKARVEKSTNPEFEKPALEALLKWKFEPAMKGGERVACKMRVPIRFQPK